MKEVKTFKCVVVNLCPHCCAQTEAQNNAANIAANQPVNAPAANRTDVQPTLAADEAENADVQLVSHESESPSLVDRFKRSFQPILGK